MTPELKATYDRLLKVRERTDLVLKKPTHLREFIKARDGTDVPLQLRGYQTQMVLHLMAMKRFVVGDDMGLGKCVTGDTLILTDKGMVPISELNPGVTTPDTFAPVTGWHVAVEGGHRPVKNFYYGGVKPTVRVRTRYGFEVEGSRVHPLLTLSEMAGAPTWKQLPDIREGDFLCVDRTTGGFPLTEPLLPAVSMAGCAPNARPLSFPDTMTPDLARFLGYLVAEGSNNHPHATVITQHRESNPEVHADIVGLCEKFWPGLAKVTDTEVVLHSVLLRRCLEAVGVAPAVSAYQVVPWSVLMATKDSVRAFLKAFMDAEGSVGPSGVEVSSASEPLLRQVQLLLLRLGMVAKRSPKKVKGRSHTYWRLTLLGQNARKYATTVGMVSRRKQDALDQLLHKPTNTNHDIVPFMAPVVRQAQTLLAGDVLSVRVRWGTPFHNALNNVAAGRADLTYELAARLRIALCEAGHGNTPVCEVLTQVLGRKFFYDPVVQCTEGEAEVMDIEVDDPEHLFVGNGLVNHNTLESIAALCHLWERDPDRKVVVLTKKSSVPQWEDELARFTEGVKVYVAKGTPVQRERAQEAWNNASGPTVLIESYQSACQDFTSIQGWGGFILVMDEATMFKTPSTRIHKVCEHLAAQAERVWALTGTLIKNSLMEGYGIYHVVVPELFRMTRNAFMTEYCIVQMQRVAGGRQVPVIRGYRDADVRRFRDNIDPFYLGRPKHLVANELPVLTARDVFVHLTPDQAAKYREALDGLLEVGSGEEKETTQLTAITYCQEIVNHLGLLEFENTESEKLDTLIDLLTEGDLAEEKVIVFTRFKRMVDIAVPELTKAGVKCVRVTGDEDENQRRAAMKAFQDPNDDTRCIFITMAGGDAINLQAAKALVFYDTPWSAGDYLQILGRMIRIGSEHDKVYAIHLVCKDTVDQRVQEVLRKKMRLVEAVLGQRLKGEGSTALVYESVSEVKDLFEALRSDALGGGK